MQISSLRIRYSMLWTLSSILFLQLLCSTGIFASPLSPDPPAAINVIHDKRATVPSTQALIKLNEKSGCMNGKVSIFFNGFTDQLGYTAAMKWGREKLGRDKVAMYNNCIPATHYQMMNTASNPDDARTPKQDFQFIVNLSKAFAWGTTSETVYLVMPDAIHTPASKSVWQSYEAPLLTRNPHVLQIVRVGYPSKKEERIWKKGDPKIGGSPTL